MVVVLLDHIIFILAGAMFDLFTQYFPDSFRIRIMFIGSYLFWFMANISTIF